MLTTANSIEQDRRTAFAELDRDLAQIVFAMDVSPPSDHLFVTRNLDRAAAGVLVGLAYRPHDICDAHAVGAKLHGVDLHLVFLDEAADGRHFRDPRHALERVPQVPVLE